MTPADDVRLALDALKGIDALIANGAQWTSVVLLHEDAVADLREHATALLEGLKDGPPEDGAPPLTIPLTNRFCGRLTTHMRHEWSMLVGDNDRERCVCDGVTVELL